MVISQVMTLDLGRRPPLSPRIQTLKAILGKMRPEPVREPLPPLKHLRTATLYSGPKPTRGPLALKSEPGPPMTLGNAARRSLIPA
jgi:hypothetical protein